MPDLSKIKPSIHQRRSIRLKGYDYSQPGAYFMTICTQNRECLFGEIPAGTEDAHPKMTLNQYGMIVRDTWIESAENHSQIELDEFVVMPNHFHGIVVFTEYFGGGSVGAIHESPLQTPQPVGDISRQVTSIQQRRNMGLSKIIGRFKMISSKQINLLRHTSGVPVWQRNYYEHVIRDENELNRIREYIINNPVNWDLDKNNPTFLVRSATIR